MKLFKTTLLLLISVFAMTSVNAAPPMSNPNYKLITPAQTTNSGEDVIEVIEVFSYGCSHCHRFEPILERWLKTKPDNVKFVQMPAIFNAGLAMYARAFYAAEALGVLDKIHPAFFEAVHVQKRRINSEAEIAALFVENGVDEEKFNKAFRSFAVEAKVRRAAELGKRYGVNATPSMVVNGKYLTDPGMTGGFQGMIKTVNNLIKLES